MRSDQLQVQSRRLFAQDAIVGFDHCIDFGKIALVGGRSGRSGLKRNSCQCRLRGGRELARLTAKLRIPAKPATYSNLMPATYSDLKPATILISCRPPFRFEGGHPRRICPGHW